MGPGAGGDFAGDSHLRTRNQVTFLAISIAGYGPQFIENKSRQRCRACDTEHPSKCNMESPTHISGFFRRAASLRSRKMLLVITIISFDDLIVITPLSLPPSSPGRRLDLDDDSLTNM